MNINKHNSYERKEIREKHHEANTQCETKSTLALRTTHVVATVLTLHVPYTCRKTQELRVESNMNGV